MENLTLIASMAILDSMVYDKAFRRYVVPVDFDVGAPYQQWISFATIEPSHPDALWLCQDIGAPCDCTACNHRAKTPIYRSSAVFPFERDIHFAPNL
jgi:hypothetical protein